MRLLIVDGDHDSAESLRAALTARGHQVSTSGDVREAYGLLTQCDLDGVVLDLFAPQQRAFDLLQALRANRRTRTLPVMLLSDSEDAQPRTRGLLLGATDCSAKPIEPQALVGQIEAMIVQQTASPGGLFGQLTTGALMEALQELEAEGGSGLLRIVGAERDGWIELDAGRIVTAHYGLLEGWPAVLAVLGVDDGHLLFEPRKLGEPAPEPAMGSTYSLPSLELRLAQLRERLQRFKVFLPEPDASLEACGQLDPELAALDDMPYAVVHERVAALPGITFGELLAQELAPTIHVQLALAILIKTSVIGTIDPGPSDVG
ncbi:MAG: response regulator [Acidobacteriota bacterium]